MSIQSTSTKIFQFRPSEASLQKKNNSISSQVWKVVKNILAKILGVEDTREKRISKTTFIIKEGDESYTALELFQKVYMISSKYSTGSKIPIISCSRTQQQQILKTIRDKDHFYLYENGKFKEVLKGSIDFYVTPEDLIGLNKKSKSQPEPV